MSFLKGLISPPDCRIYNKSESIITLIPKSCIDGAALSTAYVRADLVREIQPNKFIDVKSGDYNLNDKNHNMQIQIYFVATAIPKNDGKAPAKQPPNAAHANGVNTATGGLFFFHFDLKNKGEIYLTCGKGGKVVEVSDRALE